MENSIRKIKYTARVFYWFIIYPLFLGEIKKTLHLLLSLSRHYLFGTPHSAIIETSNTCNFNCPTCPTPHKLIYSRRPPQMMDFEVFKKAIDNIKKYVHIVYLYNSNEPLLHPRLVDMIKYCAANSLHTMISTNCSLLDEKMARQILDSGLGEIRFAFDGLTKESFESFRQGGNFEEVKENIERFCRLKKETGKSRPMTTLQFILNKFNQNQVEEIKEFAKNNNIDRVYVKPFILSEYAYDKNQIYELADKFFIDKDVYDENVVYKKPSSAEASEGKDGFGLVPKKEYKTCREASKIFTILADGRAVVCCFDLFGDYSYGRMDELDLKTLWFSDKATALRNSASQRKLPLCKTCGNIE